MTKVRPKMGAKHLFFKLPCAHHTVELALARVKAGQSSISLIYATLFAEEPSLKSGKTIVYDDFIEILNAASRAFGCYEDECRPNLLGVEIEIELAFAVVSYGVSNTATSLESKSHLISLAEPVKMIADALAVFEPINASSNMNAGTYVEAYARTAAMSFRRSLPDLANFDEEKAKKQAATALKNTMAETAFQILPEYFSSQIAWALMTKLGSRHGESQAKDRLRAGDCQP